MTDPINEKKGAADKVKNILMSRKGVAIRLVYTLLFLVALGVIANIIWIVGALQYLFLLITRAPIKPLRRFSANLSAYFKEIIDYILLISNKKPFPFSEFPKCEDELDSLDIDGIKE